MNPAVRRPAAVILAAGGSRRYGGPKLLAPLDGAPLLQHVLDAANASSASIVVLVVGHAADDVLAGVRLGRARAVRNEDWSSGQASSLQAGIRAVRAADAGADAAIVLLGDQPRVTAALVDALAERQRATGAVAVVSTWRRRRSPPALLHRDLWPDVDTLSGDVGARDLLAGRDGVVELEAGGALGTLEDVDRPDDLAGLSG